MINKFLEELKEGPTFIPGKGGAPRPTLGKVAKAGVKDFGRIIGGLAKSFKGVTPGESFRGAGRARTRGGAAAQDFIKAVSRTLAVQQSGQMGDAAADALNPAGGRRMGPRIGATGTKERREQGVSNIRGGIKSTFGTKTSTVDVKDAQGNPIKDPETGKPQQAVSGAEFGELNPMRLIPAMRRSSLEKSLARRKGKPEDLPDSKRFGTPEPEYKISDPFERIKIAKKIQDLDMEQDEIRKTLGSAKKAEPVTFRLRPGSGGYSFEGKPYGF
tara:strand:- start:148 stop:963 length:816 start_codon:yes stop_codon:yes gene_type:complete